MRFKVWIYNLMSKESKLIVIEQPDRTNLAYSRDIPEGWIFLNATEEKMTEPHLAINI